MTESEQQEQSGLWHSLRDLFGRRSGISLRESVEEALEEHEEETNSPALNEGDRAMLFNILEFGELRVDDVMVPRADIVAVELNTSLSEILTIVSEATHSRLPLFRGTLDEVVGMLHVKDLIRAVSKGAADHDFNSSNLQRPVLFVPASMRVRDLLTKMRARRTHMAIVIDEYGGTDGLVTIEDLVEQIVGEIEDEHDADDASEPVLAKMDNGCFDADARVEIEALETLTGLDFLPDDRDDDVDTLGGLVLALAGSVPEIGDIIVHKNGYRFEVVDADPRKIRKIRIYPPSEHTLSGTRSSPSDGKAKTKKKGTGSPVVDKVSGA